MLVLAVIVSQTCQKSDIQITQEEAIALATERVRFEPENTQIRLLRQGIDRHPFWIVSLSVGDLDSQIFEQLAVLRIDATSGKIVELRDQSVEQDEAKGDAATADGSGR